MNKKYLATYCRKLALVVTVALFLGAFALAPAAAQETTEILVWSLGYSGDYNDTLVERFNEAHDDVQITYEDVLTGTFTENNQKVRIALENEAGPHVLGGVDVGANLQALVSTGQVRDLTEYYRASGLDRSHPAEFAFAGYDRRADLRHPAESGISRHLLQQRCLRRFGSLTSRRNGRNTSTCLEAVKDAGYYGYTMGLAGGWPSALMASMFMYSSAGSEYIDVLSGTQPWTDCDNCLDGMNGLLWHGRKRVRQSGALGHRLRSVA